MFTFKKQFLLMMLLLFPWFLFAAQDKLSTLSELHNTLESLNQEIKLKNAQKSSALLEEDKTRVAQEIKILDQQKDEIQNRFEQIATGIDIQPIKSKESDSETSLNQDFQLLIKPLIQGAKHATENMRKKAQLQEEINYYKIVLPQASTAYENIVALEVKAQGKDYYSDLTALKKYWSQQVSLISSKLNASIHQLESIESSDLSFSESLKQSTKSFFQQRGLYLLEAFGAILVVIILTQFIHWFLVRLFPVLIKADRSFYVRLADLSYRVVATLLAFFVPMMVFYVEEDWTLFSIGLLIEPSEQSHLYGFVLKVRYF